MKLRLSYIMDNLPRYQNNLSKGSYKNGNYARITIKVEECGITQMIYDANKFPRELLEAPYYVKKLCPVATSCYHNNCTVGLQIILDKEINKYV